MAWLLGSAAVDRAAMLFDDVLGKPETEARAVSLRCPIFLRAHPLFLPVPKLWPSPITVHVHILEMNGDSYRLKQSRQKRTPSAER